MLLRTLFGFAFSLLGAASLGCSTSTSSGGDGGGPTDHPEACTANVASSSHEVPECRTPFCVPAERHLVLANPAGSHGLDASCNSAYCALTYTQGDASIYLSFDPSLAESGVDASSVHGQFKYLWAQVDFPDAPSDHSAFWYQTEPKSGFDTAFESLSFENGRLKATIRDKATHVFQHVVSDEAGCVSDDVGGECFCDYDGFTIPVVIDLDLSVGAIQGGS